MPVNSANEMRHRILWFLWGDDRYASSRLQGYGVHRQLIRMGVRSQVVGHAYGGRLTFGRAIRRLGSLVNPERDVAVIQKMPPVEGHALVEAIADAGMRVACVQCDATEAQAAISRCHRLVVTSEWLRGHYSECAGHPPISVLPDPYESLAEPDSRRYRSRSDLTAFWVGRAGNFSSTGAIRRALEDSRLREYRLITVSDHPAATYRWRRNSVLKIWRAADVCVIPVEGDETARWKSANRVTQSLALGVPVVCSDVPAFAEVIRHGENGFLFSDGAGLISALERLEDPAERHRVAQQGFADVRTRFSPRTIAARWLEELGAMQESDVSSFLGGGTVSSFELAPWKRWWASVLRESASDRALPDQLRLRLLLDAGALHWSAPEARDQVQAMARCGLSWLSAKAKLKVAGS